MRKSRLFILLSAILLVSCASNNRYSGGVIAPLPDDGSKGETDGAVEDGLPEGADGEVIRDDEDIIPGGGEISPKQLTAGAYFDQEHYQFFLSLINSSQEGNGIFKSYHEEIIDFSLDKMITVNTKPFVKIKLLENNEVTDEAISDKSGTCYLFAQDSDSQKKITYSFINQAGIEISGEENVEGKEINLSIEDVTNVEQKIELMFLIDTTGSMGDELKYLNREIEDVLEKTKTKNANVSISTSLIYYRDLYDSYVTKVVPFTDNISSLTKSLSEQNADGGGDFQEAVHLAYKDAVQQNWSKSNTTKILFHVADAPSHDKDVKEWMNYANHLADQGVHIVSVASSGIDTKTEFLFRTQSLLSNGSYVYLTDDSGIGNPHHEPTLEVSPTVEYLNSLMVRLIDGYYNGEFAEPIYYQQDNS